MRGVLRQMRWQIAAGYTLLIVCTLAALATVLYILTSSTYLRTLETGIAGQAYLVAALVEAAPPAADSAHFDALVDEVGRELAARVTLISPEGRIFADSVLPPDRYTTRSDRPEVQEALQSGFGDVQRHSNTTGDERFYVAVPFERGGAVVGIVRLAVPLTTIAATQAQIELAVLAAALIAVVVAIVLAVLIARHTTRPLLELRGMAERLAAGRLDAQVPVPAGEEVGALATSFNQMASRLRRGEQSRRVLLTNITHDLRTPLASLQALLDALVDGALDDPPTARDFLGRMDIEVQSLGRLVDEFLELSRIELGQITLQLAPEDVGELLHTVAGRMEAQASQKGVQIGVDAPCPLPTIALDRGRIEQVLLNLLQNALSFTPAGGSITMEARAQERELIVAVRDTGVGIAADHLPHIFDRFYKADPSRSDGGVGLGLAIARHLVERHGGSIWAESRPGQGTTVCFTLPIDAAQAR